MKLLPRKCRVSGSRQFCAKGLPAALVFTVGIAWLATVQNSLFAAEVPDYEQQIKPILVQYCYDCHAGGEKNGNVAFDEMKTPEQLLGAPEVWSKALRHVRSGNMPPKDEPRPDEEQKKLLTAWIKYKALAIDPADPNPGRVTMRRLNRVEYRNTIRDLMGYDYRANEEFPADDTGYGFDNIGDVLTVSPLLLEKYLKASEAIVAAALPREARGIREELLPSGGFRSEDGKFGEVLSYYKPAEVSQSFKLKHAGTYKIGFDLTAQGKFDFDPGRCHAVLKLGDKELLNTEYGWYDGKKFHYEEDVKLDAGKHTLTFTVEPLVSEDKRVNSLDLRITGTKIQGPFEPEFRVPAKNYDRFFSKETPPEDATGRREYARELISRFAKKAFRRTVDKDTVDRLLAIAEAEYSHPGNRFEDGIGRAMVAVLASPRFLFRIEEVDPAEADKAYPQIDEYSLASRLSYFLWSTMPDDELFALADKGELRKNLAAQVKRMLEHLRSGELVDNFVGQWLQVRDVEGISVNEQAVMAREDEELRKLLEAAQKAQKAQNEQDRRAAFRALRSRRQKTVEFTPDLRRAMQQEVEMLFAYILKENRSIRELIDANYAFLNERLAAHYGVPEVRGQQMRRVDLPKDSARGGILTSGAVLLVSSNPDRTSPVKRGLFVLDNVLGNPPPPPPPDVPALDESEKAAGETQPTLRALLELHRSKALCSSCHSRMDPLGLAFENFNALGMWRDKERGQPIEPAGELITGEAFKSTTELKRVLVNERRRDFYQCLTEKLLTYALGRGLSYHDVEAVDRIIERLDADDGKMVSLVTGIIESTPFQRRQNLSTVKTARAN
jgi:hypothetical protein